MFTIPEPSLFAKGAGSEQDGLLVFEKLVYLVALALAMIGLDAQARNRLAFDALAEHFAELS